MSANNKLSLIESVDDVIDFVNDYKFDDNSVPLKEPKQQKPQIPPPKITTFKWAIIDVEYNGKTKTFKDAIIKPSGPIEWNWKLDGTRHKPGITVAAIENNKLFDGVDIVILTRGVKLVLRTKEETVKYLEKAKEKGEIEDFKILQSNEAVKEYERLVANGKRVSGLFHSTC